MKNKYTQKRAGLLGLSILLVVMIGIESNLLHKKSEEALLASNYKESMAGPDEKNAGDTNRNSAKDSDRMKESELKTEKGSEAKTESNTEEMKETQKQTTPEFKESETFQDLKEELEKLKSSYEEDVSILVLNPETDEMLNLSDGNPRKAANLITLFVMETVYNQIKEGELKETKKVQKLLTSMISENKDEACNSLVEMLSPDGDDFDAGMKIVNEYIQSQGYTKTSMGRALMAGNKAAGNGENYTTALDCSTLLYKIFNKTCVDKESSQKMYDLISAQEIIDKIPEGVGAAVPVANKTGESADVVSDAALVEIYKGASYILCVIENDVKDSEQAVSEIVEISGKVYEYFEEGKK